MCANTFTLFPLPSIDHVHQTISEKRHLFHTTYWQSCPTYAFFDRDRRVHVGFFNPKLRTSTYTFQTENKCLNPKKGLAIDARLTLSKAKCCLSNTLTMKSQNWEMDGSAVEILLSAQG